MQVFSWTHQPFKERFRGARPPAAKLGVGAEEQEQNDSVADAAWLSHQAEVYLFRKTLPSGRQGGHGQAQVGLSATGPPTVANAHRGL